MQCTQHLGCSSAPNRRVSQVVQELKRECAGRDSQGRQREGSAIAWSLQRYLVFAILSCIPGACSLPHTCFTHHLGRHLSTMSGGRWTM